MSITYAGLGAGTLVPARALMRATFARTVYAWGGDSDSQVATAYRRLSENLPGTGAGFVVSPLASSPGAENFTVDIRRSSSGPALPASSIAAALVQAVGNLGPDKFELTRLALVGNESAAEASAGRDAATQAAEDAPSWFESLFSRIRSAAGWLVAVLAVVAVAVLLYLLKK